MIGRLNHVAIATNDLEKAISVYRDMLGANVSAPVPQPDHGVVTVFVELPGVDDDIAKGSELGSVESTKAVSDVFSPISGRVIAINETLSETPELINQDPYGEGWMVKLELSDAAEVEDLLSPVDYEKLVREHE